ncbi:hypothetical protein C5167_025942 [Papaver somniferum]|uniref:Uncharacterized protein n=1 Tax=Papaver somniferum TaxID=3469 RepID=A0A4Y7JVW8_PAPSO|nr:hypothetical protein C5167_025942 [Papaver somniferum]
MSQADQDKYTSPVPVIGLYTAAATLICFLLMLYDISMGFHRKKPWLPWFILHGLLGCRMIVGRCNNVYVSEDGGERSKMRRLMGNSGNNFAGKLTTEWDDVVFVFIGCDVSPDLQQPSLTSTM